MDVDIAFFFGRSVTKASAIFYHAPGNWIPSPPHSFRFVREHADKDLGNVAEGFRHDRGNFVISKDVPL